LALCFEVGDCGFFAVFLSFLYFSWDGRCPQQQSTLEAKHLVEGANSLHSENTDIGIMHNLCLFHKVYEKHKLTLPSVNQAINVETDGCSETVFPNQTACIFCAQCCVAFSFRFFRHPYRFTTLIGQILSQGACHRSFCSHV